MNLPQLAVLSALLIISLPTEALEQNEARQVYQWMKQLEGQWTLSPAERQEGKASKHPVVSPMAGTDRLP